MPTYEYTCKSCGRPTEAVQSFSDAALTVCPHCSGPLRKVFGNIGIAFKGSGFYKNDSRTATNGGAKGKEQPAAANGSGDKADTGDKAAAGDKGEKREAKKPEPASTDTKAKTPAKSTTPS